MKYKLYYEDDYDKIENVMDDIKGRSFREWDGYDLEGDTEDITLRHDDDYEDMEDPHNWRITFGNTVERRYRGHDDYSHTVTYWGYYIFFFENGDQVLIETPSENILEELRDFLNKYGCQPEMILNDDESFVV